MEKAKFLKGLMLKRRPDAKGSFKDIVELLKAFEEEDYTIVKTTRLYNLYGGEYCEYLELINHYSHKLLKEDLYFYCNNCTNDFRTRKYNSLEYALCPNCGTKLKAWR